MKSSNGIGKTVRIFIEIIKYEVGIFFFKQKTAYEVSLGLVGSEMCIRDRFYQHIVIMI